MKKPGLSGIKRFKHGSSDPCWTQGWPRHAHSSLGIGLTQECKWGHHHKRPHVPSNGAHLADSPASAEKVEKHLNPLR